MPVWRKEAKLGSDTSKILILFHYALLTEGAVKKLNKRIEKAQSKGFSRLVILSYYSTPEMMGKIVNGKEIPIYVLMNSLQMNELKTSVLKEEVASQSDYETSVKEQLFSLTY